MNIVTRLALTRIRTKKTRAVVICGAILLTVILFMTIVSISFNIFTSYSMMLRLASGTDCHGYIYTDRFSLSADELRAKMLESELVDEAFIFPNLAQCALKATDMPSSSIVMRALEDESQLTHFFTELVEGEFPSSDDEIIVNRLHFPDAKVGEPIGIYYAKSSVKDDVTEYAQFLVSGIIESRCDSQLPAIMRHSDTLTERYGFANSFQNIYFMLDGRADLTGKLDALVNEALAEYKLDGFDRYGVLSPAYLETTVNEAATPANVMLILFSVAVVFFCSFLLIYNIYSIALTQDMHSLGLLSVIGMTHRQIRRHICTESLLLFAATLPAGMIGGYFIGWRMLSPLLFSSLSREGLEFEFSPWIVVLTLILTLFTLLWSATRPLGKLKSMTPIATVEYSPTTEFSARYVRKKNYARKNRTPSVSWLALSSLSRNRKKTLITALSMSLSVMLFMLISTLCEYMITFTESEMQQSDYIVKAIRVYRYSDSPEERTANLRADDGIGIADSVEAVIDASSLAERTWKIRTEQLVLNTSPSTQKRLSEFSQSFSRFESFGELQSALDGKITALAVSIPDELFAKLRKNGTDSFGETDGEVIGEIIQFGDNDSTVHFSYFDENETVKIGSGEYRVRLSESLTPESGIIGYLHTDYERAIVYIPESIFLRELGQGLTYAILVDAKEDCYDSMRAELEAIGRGFDVEFADYYDPESDPSYTVMSQTLGYKIDIGGRFDGLDQMRSIVLSIQAVGYSLAAMIFLVGVLNIVNTSLSSVFERKRELAMLESIGMTDRQLMRMLLGESLFAGSIALAITFLCGVPLILLIVCTAMDAMVTVDLRSGAIMLAACIAVSLASGAAVFRLTKSTAVVERIKVE